MDSIGVRGHIQAPDLMKLAFTLLMVILGLLVVRTMLQHAYSRVKSFFHREKSKRPISYGYMAVEETLKRSLIYSGLLDWDEFPKAVISELLKQQPGETGFRPKLGMHYPQRPLYKELALSLLYIAQNGKSHLRERVSVWESMDISHITTEAIHDVERRFCNLIQEWEGVLGEDVGILVAHTADLLSRLGIENVLLLLGMNRTFGSVNMLPPPRSQLIESASLLHSDKDKKSVAHVAFTKHYHRSSEEWYGEMKGNDAAKNAHALEIVKKILDNPSWMNMHVLPPSLTVLEVRTAKGYGARWTADGKAFRGFLEPQMEDGHTKGWKH